MSRRRSRSRSHPIGKVQPLAHPNATPNLVDALDAIDRWLYRHRRRMRLALQPGLDAAALDSLRCELNDALPEELGQLLTWHDGQTPDFMGTFADGWTLLRAEDIPPLKADLDVNPPPGWQAGWIPWARSTNDSFLVIAPASSAFPVRVVGSGQGECPVLAPSLTAWFATFLEDVQAGRYAEDSERGTFLKIDQDGGTKRS